MRIDKFTGFPLGSAIIALREVRIVDNLKQFIGIKIALARKALKLTQEQLAEQSDLRGQLEMIFDILTTYSRPSTVSNPFDDTKASPARVLLVSDPL